MINTENISKQYGTLTAVDGWTMQVEKGGLYGVIGPDGAGKTTFFRLLTTMLLPSGGRARVCGYDVVKDYRKVRQLIGYMPGKFSLYEDLSVEENLNFFASVFNCKVSDNIALVNDIYSQLVRFKDRRAGKLSGGMKQKLALCCAMIHRPEVLFLDEPTTGVDVVSRREFWEMLKKLAASGITILVSTPYMDEAEMCSRIALVSGGRFLTEDSPAGLVKKFDGKIFAVSADNMSSLSKDLKKYAHTKTSFSFGNEVHLRFDDGGSVAGLTEYLQNLSHNNISVSEITPSVEDCFMALTNA